ncbi:MAG: PilZ domain-containing protein [Acidobacteriota bacterium]
MRSRKDQRIELIDEVYYEVGRTETLARWTDISRNGIFVQTMRPLPVGDQVKLRIRLGKPDKYYRAVGIVRHSLDFVGMGVEFTHLHPEAKGLIEEMVAVTSPGSKVSTNS